MCKFPGSAYVPLQVNVLINKKGDKELLVNIMHGEDDQYLDESQWMLTTFYKEEFVKHLFDKFISSSDYTLEELEQEYMNQELTKLESIGVNND